MDTEIALHRVAPRHLVPVQAHGGVEQVAGNSIVILNQSPISPLVGEPVKMDFSFVDKNFQPLKNLDFKLTLIDTFFNDASRDQTVLTKAFKTDNNGFAEFQYTFPKENYFDVHLDFQEPDNGSSQQVGFLVQPRAAAAANKTKTAQRYATIGVLAALIGFILGRQLRSRAGPAPKQ